MSRPGSGLDCLTCAISGLDCLICAMYGFDWLVYAISDLDCLICAISGLDCLMSAIYGLDCLISATFAQWGVCLGEVAFPNADTADALRERFPPDMALTVLHVPYAPSGWCGRIWHT